MGLYKVKKIFLFFLFLITIGCNNINTKLEKLWNSVVESPNEGIESDNIVKLTRYLSEKQLSFDLIVTDINSVRHRLPYGITKEDILVKDAVLIVYDGKKNKEIFVSGKWEPKAKENIYAFLLE